MKNKLRFAIVCIAVIVAAICIYGERIYFYTFHFYPGSTVNGINVSGMTAEEAQASVETELESYQLTIYGKDTEDTISAADIELSYEFGNELEQAVSEQNAFGWISAMIFRNKGSQIILQTTYDAEKLSDTVKTLSCVSPDEVIATENANYTYEDGQYIIVPEVNGNVADEENVYNSVCAAIESGDTEVSVEDCYITAEITSEDEALNQIVDAANLILSSDITITTTYSTVTLDADTIQTFLVFTDDTVDLDEDTVYAWVRTNISSPNYTVGASRTIKTPSSGEITVSGGTYGMNIDTSAETTQLIEELKASTTTTREPNYETSEVSSENGGVGYTYIDVNISEQMVYLVEDNVITYSTECVTGDVASGYDTPTGTYYVSWKANDYTMKTYDSFVYYWMPIDDMNGVGLHDATWRSSFGGTIYQTNGSHGCINLPYEAAKYLYENTDVGIPVIVH